MAHQQKQDDDQYAPDEAQRRFEAAIRAAGRVGHVEMKDIPRKPRAKRQRKTILKKVRA